MNRSLLVSLIPLFLVACSAKSNDSGDALDSTESALSTDNSDSQEAEDGLEDGIENGLGGATATDQGGAVDGTDVAAVDAKIATNPGLFFKPSGCVVSTKLSPGKWSHVFTNCTGPAGRVIYNGTVVSTWAVDATALKVTHEAQGFSAKGAKVTVTASGSREVTYSRAGTLLSKHRVGNWTGTVAKNEDASASAAWTHAADFTSTWDTASRCYTRDGSAENSIGNRTFGRSVTGFKICGGLFACPSSGEFVVSRKDGAAKLTVTFLGGQDVEIEGARGRTIHVKLLCNANGS